eukprot:gene2882-38470_t
MLRPLRPAVGGGAGAAAAVVLDAVGGALRRSPFRAGAAAARVISGEEEARGAWLAVNYLAGPLARGGTGRTAAVLDMGGGSVQAVFAGADAGPPLRFRG